MYTVYKDGTELSIDRDQLKLFTDEGWSTKKEAKAEEGIGEGGADNKEPNGEGSENSGSTGTNRRRSK